MLNANVARSWSPSGLCLWVMRRQGSRKIKKAAWVEVEVEMPVRGHRYGLHTHAHTRRLLSVASWLQSVCPGELRDHCTVLLLSCPCYVGHRFPPTISYPFRSAVNTVDRTPQIAVEVYVASSALISLPQWVTSGIQQDASNKIIVKKKKTLSERLFFLTCCATAMRSKNSGKVFFFFF